MVLARKILLPICISTLCSVSLAAQSADKVEIYQYYPDCEYTVLDEVKIKGKVNIRPGEIFENALEETRLKVIEDILELAQQQGADGIILTDKSVQIEENKPQSPIKNNHITMGAELVRNCAPNAPLSDRATPFDENGLKKQTVQLGTVSLPSIQLRIELNNGNQRITPDLATQRIDIESGVFGLKLGSSLEQAKQMFGTPTAVFNLSASTQLLAYGRDFWLTFEGDKLVHATNQNQWFTNTFLSLLAFDNRFEKQQWEINGRVTRNTLMTQAAEQLQVSPVGNPLVLQEGAAKLILTGNEGEQDLTLSGFQLTRLNNTIATFDLKQNDAAYNAVLAHINESEASSLSVENLTAMSLGQGWLDKDSMLLLMDNHLVLFIKNGQVSQVQLLESVFNDDVLTDQTKWQLGKLKQGQAFEEVEAVLGDSVFAFGDTIELDTGRTMQQYFFEESDIGLTLLSAEINIF